MKHVCSLINKALLTCYRLTIGSLNARLRTGNLRGFFVTYSSARHQVSSVFTLHTDTPFARPTVNTGCVCHHFTESLTQECHLFICRHPGTANRTPAQLGLLSLSALIPEPPGCYLLAFNLLHPSEHFYTVLHISNHQSKLLPSNPSFIYDMSDGARSGFNLWSVRFSHGM